jgi:hypothetical protein
MLLYTEYFYADQPRILPQSAVYEVVMFGMAFLKRSLPTREEALQAIDDPAFDKYFAHAEVKNFFKQCLSVNAADRPEAKQLLDVRSFTCSRTYLHAISAD